MAANNPRVDCIEKLKPIYEALLRKHGAHDKFVLSIYHHSGSRGRSDISFSDLEKMADILTAFKQ